MTTSDIRGLRASFTRDQYVSPDVFASDMDQVYAKNWCYVGRADTLNRIGDRVVAQVGDESILIVRNRDNVLRAYYNVCQHRGSRLCDESGSGHGAAITCPYHAWTYSLDGRLVSAIHHEKESFDREGISLKGVRVDEWQGCLFVCLSDEQVGLIDWLESLYSKPRDMERFNFVALKSVRVTVDEIQANWKVLIENYSECLHCSVVHPELCDIVPVYRTGRTTEAGREDWGATLAPGKTAVSFAQQEQLPYLHGMADASMFGAYVYPNMVIDVMPTCAVISTYVPRSATRTTVITDYLFPADVAAHPPVDLEPTLAFYDLVIHQDFVVSERAQRGVASKSFRQVYHTEMETYAQQFVKQYRQDTAS